MNMPLVRSKTSYAVLVGITTAALILPQSSYALFGPPKYQSYDRAHGITPPSRWQRFKDKTSSIFSRKPNPNKKDAKSLKKMTKQNEKSINAMYDKKIHDQDIAQKGKQHTAEKAKLDQQHKHEIEKHQIEIERAKQESVHHALTGDEHGLAAARERHQQARNRLEDTQARHRQQHEDLDEKHRGEIDSVHGYHNTNREKQARIRNIMNPDHAAAHDSGHDADGHPGHSAASAHSQNSSGTGPQRGDRFRSVVHQAVGKARLENAAGGHSKAGTHSGNSPSHSTTSTSTTSSAASSATLQNPPSPVSPSNSSTKGDRFRNIVREHVAQSKQQTPASGQAAAQASGATNLKVQTTTSQSTASTNSAASSATLQNSPAPVPPPPPQHSSTKGDRFRSAVREHVAQSKQQPAVSGRAAAQAATKVNASTQTDPPPRFVITDKHKEEVANHRKVAEENMNKLDPKSEAYIHAQRRVETTKAYEAALAKGDHDEILNSHKKMSSAFEDSYTFSRDSYRDRLKVQEIKAKEGIRQNAGNQQALDQANATARYSSAIKRGDQAEAEAAYKDIEKYYPDSNTRIEKYNWPASTPLMPPQETSAPPKGTGTTTGTSTGTDPNGDIDDGGTPNWGS